MLEAQAHQQLKTLLRREESDWPHHLTLSRLVGRSLRRRDSTLLRLSSGTDQRWWLGLLVPLCLSSHNAVLVIDRQQRRRLLEIELPRLRNQGFRLPCWEGDDAPDGDQLWLLDEAGLVRAHQSNRLGGRQLLLPQVDRLSTRLRRSMAIHISVEDWESLRRSHPAADGTLLEWHNRLSSRLFRQAAGTDARVRLHASDTLALTDLLRTIGAAPAPWPSLLAIEQGSWASWAELDHGQLQWRWCLEPLEPLQLLDGLLRERPVLMLSEAGTTDRLDSELEAADVRPDVTAMLRDAELMEPLPVYAPRRQPLPNTEIYAQHLLEQSRRLILGRSGLSVVLLDDTDLRRWLTSGLAGEFGSRVMEETTAPDTNGVISARWSWWLEHRDQLPEPDQLIVALLPIASLRCPLTAARVERMKQQGEDWFRTLLLPEALRLIPPAIAPLRRGGGRLAVLDGRLRGRTWGEQVLRCLEPWTPLQRLLPD